MNSLQETLAFGRPALVLPQAFDQLDAACRLERLGLGLYLPPDRQSVPDIRERLGALLADKDIAGRAALWARERRVEQGISVEEALVLT
jgi:UDP:flavonoid glycosyltransferase YjiC (YdhE family)